MSNYCWMPVAGFMLAACAKSPESISPSYISDVGYQSWTCEQLGGEQMRLGQALATASTQQRHARTNDTVGVIFLGLPVSSISGDNIAPEIARLKAKMKPSFEQCGSRAAQQLQLKRRPSSSLKSLRSSRQRQRSNSLANVANLRDEALPNARSSN
jgi:hypothetical protein